MASSKPHCNCKVKESCPLNGDCLQSSVVYGCKITSNNTAEDSPHYIGLTENTFKDVNTRAPLNTRLKRIAPNSQTTYGT